MMLRDYQAYIWLLILAVLSAWLVSLADFEERPPPAAIAHHADYFSYGYSKTEMDALGKPKSYLHAVKMTHYGDDNTTELEAPVMLFFNKDQPPWEIRSETAQLSADGKDLYMQGKAVVERAAAPGLRRVKVNSSNLRVKPEISYAETDAWAELISPPDITTGIGMKVTFSKPIHLQLLSNVKGRYDVK
ncbi:MAG: LPS export ABC transporter periplasmic protein LptC [Gammaproteobacteria bacterium]